MACSCTKRKKFSYLWIPEGESSESPNTVLYKTEIEAKAKVLRKGGSYMTLTLSESGQYMAARTV